MSTSWLIAAVFLVLTPGCRLHPLDDGVYLLVPGQVLRDDCSLASSELLGTGTLRTEGNLVTLSLTKPELRLVGIYRAQVEEMTLDGSISNYSTVLRGRDCLLDAVSYHLDAVTVDASRFEGSMSINYEARQPDECACRLWFNYEARRQ